MSNSIDNNVLEKRIKEIIKGADLESLTTKKIRQQLETEFKADLGAQKKFINEIIDQVINGKDEEEPEEKPSKKRSRKTEYKEDDDDEEEEDDGDSDSSYEKPRKRAAKKSKPAKPKAKKSRKKTSSDDEGGKSNGAKKSGKGYMKACRLSEDLAAFVGEPELPRHAVVKKVWGYVKERNLYDPKNKQFAVCDEAMLKIFGLKRIRLFGMMKHLSKHISND